MFRRDNLPPPPHFGGLGADAGGGCPTGEVHLPELVDALQPVEVTAVLQCAGNGRGLLAGPPPGTPWRNRSRGERPMERGRAWPIWLLWPEAPWTGAKFLTALGADGAAGDPERVERSVPLRGRGWSGACSPSDSTESRSPRSHGGPIRLVIPGYFAVNSVKWVVRLAPTAEESDASIQTVRYRLTPPGSTSGPDDPSCWEMPVKSWVTRPGAGRGRVGSARGGGGRLLRCGPDHRGRGDRRWGERHGARRRSVRRLVRRHGAPSKRRSRSARPAG